MSLYALFLVFKFFFNVYIQMYPFNKFVIDLFPYNGVYPLWQDFVTNNNNMFFNKLIDKLSNHYNLQKLWEEVNPKLHPKLSHVKWKLLCLLTNNPNFYIYLQSDYIVECEWQFKFLKKMYNIHTKKGVLRWYNDYTFNFEENLISILFFNSIVGLKLILI